MKSVLMAVIVMAFIYSIAGRAEDSKNLLSKEEKAMLEMCELAEENPENIMFEKSCEGYKSKFLNVNLKRIRDSGGCPSSGSCTPGNPETNRQIWEPFYKRVQKAIELGQLIPKKKQLKVPNMFKFNPNVKQLPAIDERVTTILPNNGGQ